MKSSFIMELTSNILEHINNLSLGEKYIIHNQAKGKKCTVIKSKQYKTWVFMGLDSKNYLKQLIAYNKERRYICDIQNDKGIRQFVSFESMEQCWNLYKFADYDKRYLNVKKNRLYESQYSR